MIVPRTRASFARTDAMEVVELIGNEDPELVEASRRRLAEDGFDALLDDPRTLNAILTREHVAVSPPVVFYVIVRHALLESGMTDRFTADYLTTLIMVFGQGDRAYRVSEGSGEEFHYLVDLVARLKEADARESFLIQSHLGNYALWLTGLFPDFIEHRVARRGAPPMSYYEMMGSSGFRGAAGSRHAEELGLVELFGAVARDFPILREALNRMADRHLWGGEGNPVGRLLREVSRRAPRG